MKKSRPGSQKKYQVEEEEKEPVKSNFKIDQISSSSDSQITDGQINTTNQLPQE